MLSVAGADRLQQGMRGAWGKPAGIVARVNINQVLVSLRTTDRYRATAIEALRRAMYKFPGRQKLVVSRNWGFTKLPRDEYERMKEEGKLLKDGAYVKYLRQKGPIADNVKNYPIAFLEEMADAG